MKPLDTNPIPLVPPDASTCRTPTDIRFQSTIASWTITTLLLVNLLVFFGIFATLRRMDTDLNDSLNGFKHRTVERWAYLKRENPSLKVAPVIESGIAVDPIFLQPSPSPTPQVDTQPANK